MLVQDSKYVCDLCGAAIDVALDELGRILLWRPDNRPGTRVVWLAGKELHACPLRPRSLSAVKQGQRFYVCPACNVAITVSAEREPAVTIEAPDDGPTIRIVSVVGAEVHRCILPDAPRSVRRH